MENAALPLVVEEGLTDTPYVLEDTRCDSDVNRQECQASNDSCGPGDSVYHLYKSDTDSYSDGDAYVYAHALAYVALNHTSVHASISADVTAYTCTDTASDLGWQS
jgi:hypothetical protein